MTPETFAKKQTHQQFQSTHPRRVWQGFQSLQCYASSFNPHTHEGCDAQTSRLTCLGGCFNPHTHEGCDGRTRIQSQGTRVSIHTPTKGVTACSPAFSVTSVVSIHTPTKGVTKAFSLYNVMPQVSIHTPTKGVTNVGSGAAATAAVSIHTPTKGVTFAPNTTQTHMISFNPHTHEGCDATKSGIFSSASMFQSTHPRRVWLAKIGWFPSCDEFQSTHPRRVWRCAHS